MDTVVVTSRAAIPATVYHAAWIGPRRLRGLDGDAAALLFGNSFEGSASGLEGEVGTAL